MRTLLCGITMLALSSFHSTLADDTSRTLAKSNDAVPSIAEARKVLDLSQIPLAPGAEKAPRRPIFPSPMIAQLAQKKVTSFTRISSLRLAGRNFPAAVSKMLWRVVLSRKTVIHFQ